MIMVKEFDAQLHKGDNPGAWTCVVMDDAKELFGTRDCQDPRRDRR